MKLSAALALCALLAAPSAQGGGVLVELYTSQGCSSCPPADAALADLAARPDVVALGLHVDYWDYLGWRDTFGQAAFSERQRAYRDAWGKRVVYTPQIVVQGVADVLGSDRAALARAVAQAAPGGTALAIAEQDGMLVARLSAQAPGAAGTIYVAKYLRDASVAVLSGELAGRVLRYHNAVVSLDRIGPWDGTAPREVMLPQPAQGEGVAVWVQQGAGGPVLAAAKHER